ARVVLAGRYHREPAFRGVVHMLSELHIPYAIRDDLEYLERPDEFDLVITTSGAGPAVADYVRSGGRLLVTGATPPEFDDLPAIVRRWDAVETAGSYWRVQHTDRFPSLETVDLIPLDGPYVESEAESPLTLVPPATFSPPDVVALDQRDTDKPGLLLNDYGAGRMAYLPWEIGELYYATGNPTYRALFADLIDDLLPSGRQLETDAHPLVEITLMEQPGRTLAHLVNLSGYSGSSFHQPIPMQNVTISVEGTYLSAHVAGEQLRLGQNEGRTSFVVPSLGDYEVVLLESPLFEYHRIDNIGAELGQTSLADVDNDGDLDWIAGQSDRRGGDVDQAGLFWYEIPPDPRAPWTQHLIASSASHEIHGGVSPRAVGDIDGDGDNDVVTGQAWYENVDGAGLRWAPHMNIDFGEVHQYGLAVRTWVADLDGDGDLDVVQSEADNPDGRVAWFENDGRGNWQRHIIKDRGERQDFHSLAVADFDLDGDLDVFSGGGPLSAEGTQKVYVWENLAGPRGNPGTTKWREHIIARMPVHELEVADVDGDGDPDLVGKPWSVGDEHFFLRNTARE
ncbi:MAG: VCBS repeat-containing protein, partial [Rhodothermales bacterium]